jgi:hypothetical protein
LIAHDRGYRVAGGVVCCVVRGTACAVLCGMKRCVVRGTVYGVWQGVVAVWGV